MTRTLEVLGTDIEVTLDRGFRLIGKLNGEEFVGNTIEELKEKLAREIKRTRTDANIAVVLDVNGKLQRATLRRKHATLRGTWLYTVGAEAMALLSAQIVCLAADVTDEQIAEVNALREAMARARDAETLARRKFERLGLRPERLVESQERPT